MKILTLIDHYQTLAGSFLAIIFSISFWYFKGLVDDRNQRQKNIREIENIFWMAARESEEAVRNITYYVSRVRTELDKNKYDIHVYIPQKFNRVYVNEERLFILKSNLSFGVSQQIDIATSAAKMFNGYLEGFEFSPKLIFESSLKLLDSGISTKEETKKHYRADILKNLNDIDRLLGDEILIAQRHLLRPLTATAHKDRLFWEKRNIDWILDKEAELLLVGVKEDAR